MTRDTLLADNIHWKSRPMIQDRGVRGTVKATRAAHTCSLPAAPTCPVNTPLFPTHLCSLPSKKPPLCSLVSPRRTLRPSYKPPLPCSLPGLAHDGALRRREVRSRLAHQTPTMEGPLEIITPPLTEAQRGQWICICSHSKAGLPHVIPAPSIFFHLSKEGLCERPPAFPGGAH